MSRGFGPHYVPGTSPTLRGERRCVVCGRRMDFAVAAGSEVGADGGIKEVVPGGEEFRSAPTVALCCGEVVVWTGEVDRLGTVMRPATEEELAAMPAQVTSLRERARAYNRVANAKLN